MLKTLKLAVTVHFVYSGIKWNFLQLLDACEESVCEEDEINLSSRFN